MNHTLKIERLLSTASELGFTRYDFADLALAAARRSGAAVAEQTRVASALGLEAEERDHGTKHDQVTALARLCEQLGGRLMIVTQRTLSNLFNRDWPDEGDEGFDDFDLEHHEGFSPTDENDMQHGLNWREKNVYAVRGHERIASIIHEMGHVFADRYPPDSSRCREWRWFGWEMVIARRIGAWGTWSRHNARYGVGDVEWGELSTRRRQAIIADRIKHAKRIGILSEAGEPRSVRE